MERQAFAFASLDQVQYLSLDNSFIDNSSTCMPADNKAGSISIRDQFPDQFAPFMFFGCDLQTPFKGTLFRFPFRFGGGAIAVAVAVAAAN